MVHVVLLPRSRTTTLVGAAAMLPPLEYMAGLQLTGGLVRSLVFYNLVGRARARPFSSVFFSPPFLNPPFIIMTLLNLVQQTSFLIILDLIVRFLRKEGNDFLLIFSFSKLTRHLLATRLIRKFGRDDWNES